MAKKPTNKKRKTNEMVKPDWARTGNHKFMPIEPWESIKTWLFLDPKQRIVQMEMLQAGLPSNDIAEVSIDKERGLIGLKANHKDWNSFRLFDPEAFAFTRLLMAFGGRIRINNRQATDPKKKSGPKTFHPTVTLHFIKNVPLSRLLWGATLNEEMDQIQSGAPATESRQIPDLVGTFYDLSMANMKTVASKGAKRDRSDAIMSALAYRNNASMKFDGLPSGDEYLALLLKCVELLEARKADVLKQREG